MCGLGEIRLNLVRDLAALNGFPSVSGDSWKLGSVEAERLTVDDLVLLDRAAELAIESSHFEECRRLYAASEGLRPPEVLQHFDYITLNKLREVEWAQE